MKQKIFSTGEKCSLSPSFRSLRVDWSEFFELLPILLLFVIVFGGISWAMFCIGNWLLGAFSAFWCVFLCAFLVFTEYETIIKNK